MSNPYEEVGEQFCEALNGNELDNEKGLEAVLKNWFETLVYANDACLDLRLNLHSVERLVDAGLSRDPGIVVHTGTSDLIIKVQVNRR